PEHLAQPFAALRPVHQSKISKKSARFSGRREGDDLAVTKDSHVTKNANFERHGENAPTKFNFTNLHAAQEAFISTGSVGPASASFPVSVPTAKIARLPSCVVAVLSGTGSLERLLQGSFETSSRTPLDFRLRCIGKRRGSRFNARLHGSIHVGFYVGPLSAKSSLKPNQHQRLPCTRPSLLPPSSPFSASATRLRSMPLRPSGRASKTICRTSTPAHRSTGLP